MRDFSPSEMSRRNYIFDSIRSVFKMYGYEPIETPTMENLSTLMGKYGAEGDKLLFKVLNSGDFTRGVDFSDASSSANPALLASQLCEKGLRYDLTVPFARYVVQHQNDIVFPFKRFQIQPVWRADRPQKGRYREFYQCDVDVVGSDSLLWEVELIQIVQDVFAALGVRVVLKINNRKVLQGIADAIGFGDKIIDITVAIDKLDKVGIQAVEAELVERGLSVEAVGQLRPILDLAGTNHQKLDALSLVLNGKSEVGMRGIEELRAIFDFLSAAGVVADSGEVGFGVELDLSLARGLNYYTGAIFEVKALDYPMGSISGGGRYDDLTGIFGLKGVSGVGISFGADRIYDVMQGLELFPESVARGGAAQVMFVNFGGQSLSVALELAARLRHANAVDGTATCAGGVSCEVYSDTVKLKKQFEYATRRGVKYLVFIGDDELAAGTFTIKDIDSGEQWSVVDIVEFFVKR